MKFWSETCAQIQVQRFVSDFCDWLVYEFNIIVPEKSPIKIEGKDLKTTKEILLEYKDIPLKNKVFPDKYPLTNCFLSLSPHKNAWKY